MTDHRPKGAEKDGVVIRNEADGDLFKTENCCLRAASGQGATRDLVLCLCRST